MTADELLRRYAAGERDFTRADLTNANLTNANLTDAKLRRANLAYANLTDADLTNAILTRADFTNADLTNANLTDARLNDATFKGANLKGANLKWARLTGANLKGATLPPVPVVPSLDRQILEQGALDMNEWHTCDTTHCLAGWAIHFAGDAGYALEGDLGPAVAGALIWHASTGSVPDFYASNKEALAGLRKRANA